jgi:replicative DNA helicase
MDIRTGLQKILDSEKYDDNAIHPDIKKSCVSFIEYIQKGHVKSYLDYFDITQNGIPIDSFVIIAALSSNGKTSYIINQMTKMILDGKRVCFFSLEMSEFAIIEQIVANLSGINTLEIKAGMSQITESKISDALDKLYTHNNLWIYDRPRTIDDIIEKAKYQKEKNKIDYIFVDYIQIIRSGIKNIVERLDFIATELQGLSRILQIPVIALSQFNRSVENERPDVTKLKGSGTLEQSADIVILMHNQSAAIDGDFGRRLVNFYIGKNRKGMKDIEYQEIFKPATRQFLYQGLRG